MKKAQNHPELTKEYLDSILRYEPDTGLFFWRSDRNATVIAGASAGWFCKGYRRIGINGSIYLAHRLAWVMIYGSEPDDQIDHINHNPSDNRLINIRAVTHTENQMNRSVSANNTSGITGVYFSYSRNKWEAQIKVKRKKIALGRFSNLLDAVVARKSAEIKYGFHENHGKAVVS